MRWYQQGLKHSLGICIWLCYAPCSPNGYTELSILHNPAPFLREAAGRQSMVLHAELTTTLGAADGNFGGQLHQALAQRKDLMS